MVDEPLNGGSKRRGSKFPRWRLMFKTMLPLPSTPLTTQDLKSLQSVDTIPFWTPYGESPLVRLQGPVDLDCREASETLVKF